MDYRRFTEDLKVLFMKLLPLYVGSAHGNVGTKIKVKPDTTPVVDLDNLALARLRELIQAHFPEDLTIGEEDRRSPAEMARILSDQDRCQWTIDGLDGTWHYIRRTNSYGGMASRRQGNRILYVTVFRPVDTVLRGNGFFYAEHGQGAWEWCGDCRLYHRLQTAPYGALERVTVLLEGPSKGFFRPPITKLGQVITTRPSLSSCIAATTVARGDATAVVTVDNKPWDNWPMIAMIEGAGGIVTDYQGQPYSLADCGNIVAAANEEDHARLIELLNS